MSLLRESKKISICNQDDLSLFLSDYNLQDLYLINPPISFNSFGSPLSYYNDDVWNFSENKTKINGYSSIITWSDYLNLNSSFLFEFKYILLKNIFNLNTSKLVKRFVGKLYPFFYTCQEIKLNSIRELSSDVNFTELLKRIDNSYTSGTLKDMLLILKSADINSGRFIGISWESDVFRSNSKGFSIKVISAKYSKNKTNDVEQTLYIPNKIHSLIIDKCISVVDKGFLDIDKYMNFLEDDYLLYESIIKSLELDSVSSAKSKKKIKNKKQPQTANLLKKHKIDLNSALDVQKEVRLLATACLILILSFSGMRINELYNIEKNGFKVVDSKPKLYVIRSFETKISGGQKVDYITSPIIKEVFDILLKINAFARKYDASINGNELLVSSKHQKLITFGKSNAPVLLKEFVEKFEIRVSQEDLSDSDLLNGPRNNINIGDLWPLSSHQFRRTLIVNFISHRLSDINAVKQQVKHMYATMTEYYAKNSMLADSFNLNVVNSISENIEEELLNEGVRQYKRFHYSDEDLSGVNGKKIVELRNNLKVLSDDEIKKLFKTGLYKLSRSMYGYCTKGNLCDKKEAIDPTFCGASCSTMIITKENAINWQKLYFRNKKLLEGSSNLVVAGIPLSAVKTTMQGQNEVAKKIMSDFKMNFEE